MNHWYEANYHMPLSHSLDPWGQRISSLVKAWLNTLRKVFLQQNDWKKKNEKAKLKEKKQSYAFESFVNSESAAEFEPS